MSLVCIIGSGLMGSAMSVPAVDNGHQVNLVGTPLDRHIIESLRQNGVHPTLPCKLPENMGLFQFEQLEQALSGAELIICGVSSFGVDWFAREVLPQLPSAVPLINVTKGLREAEPGVLQSFPQYFCDIRPDMAFAAIGGPCTSYELAERRQTLVYFCSEKIATAEFARKLLQTDYYHIVVTDDVIGLECSVAMKNAYAMGVSLAIGMSEKENEESAGKKTGVRQNQLISGAHDGRLHYNPQAALFGQSCVEMRRLVRLLGGNGDLAGGIPGAGDLYVTVFGGRTRRLGTLLGKGLSYAEVKKKLAGVTLEAVAVIETVSAALRHRAAKNGLDLHQFPLLMHMESLLKGNTGKKLPWKQFGE
ncbi:MAG: glycerol-3-phosphate dehydrogenase [Lentisphaeria bacterium]|nr:glycerol-3-phosphate dehydrogenase [Lentisphaeria bacterium]